MHKKNEKEFAMQDFWSENKHFVALFITVAACLAMVALTVWWTYKFVGGQGVPAMDRLTSALTNWDVIPGK